MKQTRDKRKLENLRVKQAVFRALLELLEEKSMDEIKITELTGRAHVARMSFYRNYESKKDIIRQMLFFWLDEYLESHPYDTSYFASYNNILFSLGFMKEHGKDLLSIHNLGMTTLLLETLNEFHEVLTGDMPQNDPERYQIYLYIGGLYNVAVIWMQSGMTESLEEIANIVSKYFSWRKI